MDDSVADSDSGTHFVGAESPLLNNFVDGVVDYRGRPVIRSKYGGWRSAYFIISVEVAERFAYHGASSNLITYLTGPLGQSTATAAANVSAWSGTSSLLTLVVAFIADTFLGRYLTIIIVSVLYVLSPGLMALSTLLTSDCEKTKNSSCSSHLQVILFFIPLYLLALSQGGFKPCFEAFGADQFDADNPEERKAKSSFFNWWYFGSCIGSSVGILVLSYIQDNLSWGLGFGIPSFIMAFSLIAFLTGTITYRFHEKTKEKSAFLRIGHVFVTAARNWQTTPSKTSSQVSQQFRFLNKALVNGSNEDGTVCSIDEVEEAKAVLRLVPIWVSCLGYATVFTQGTTLFIKQGATMDRSIGSNFQIPAATLQSFIGLSVLILIPIYDTIFVPVTRVITRKPAGITMLQRIGIGILIYIISLVVAAVVETKRLNTAREYGLVDDPSAIVPMTIWWLLPQYLLLGAGNVFAAVGVQEFFYDQVPSDLRSIGLALQLSIVGVGSFLSSFLVKIVEKTTGGNNRDGWISDNMNRGHVDYFYYLLAGIITGSFVMYIYFAKYYVYTCGRGL